MGQNTALLLKPRALVPTHCKNSFRLKHRLTPIPPVQRLRVPNSIAKARSGLLLDHPGSGLRPG